MIETFTALLKDSYSNLLLVLCLSFMLSYFGFGKAVHLIVIINDNPHRYSIYEELSSRELAQRKYKIKYARTVSLYI